MKKKNGFTLIELLAVIVILAVIALIAVLQLLKILNKARLSAAEDSVYGIVKSAETYVSNFMLQNNGTLPSVELEFNCNGTSCNLTTTLDSTYNLDGLSTLEFKGTKPKGGKIRISNNGTNIMTSLEINGFSCNYPIDNRVVCSKDENAKNNEYVSDNLLVRYNYEDGSNTSNVLKDLSGNGYDGAINGATLTNDGLVFDGVDDYVGIAEINNPNFTWEVNFKLNSLNLGQTIMGNPQIGGCAIELIPNGKLNSACYIDNGYKNLSKYNFSTNQMYSVVITYDGDVFKFYVNGCLVDKYISPSGIKYPDDNTILMLGANPGGNVATSVFFNGSIYSVRVYDRALNEAEIKYNYMIDSARYNS